ncbi:MAG: hypothetical protein R2911_36840 [Caldilineaceae bacterium]
MKQFSVNPLLFVIRSLLPLLAACGPEETDIPAEVPPAEITIITGNNPTQVEEELFRAHSRNLSWALALKPPILVAIRAHIWRAIRRRM